MDEIMIIQFQCWGCGQYIDNFWRWEIPFMGNDCLQRSPALPCEHSLHFNYIYVDICQHENGMIYKGSQWESPSLSEVVRRKE